ncbi:MAG TPA: fluoride efflux transporter CrcB [Pseudonocardia sp.]|jgi:fluoride exporter|nr:fluoride efflux transporter CrcB [Pseudonocardia sp.]
MAGTAAGRAPGTGAAVVAVAAGGVLGALARHGAGVLLAHPPGGFPLATLLVNVLGCLLIGVLVVLVTEVVAAHPLVRPFLGTGVLGGFTTFSTYAVDVHALAAAGRPAAALTYLAGTLGAAVAATWAGTALARAAAGAR